MLKVEKNDKDFGLKEHDMSVLCAMSYVGILCQLRNRYKKLFDQLVCFIILHRSDKGFSLKDYGMSVLCVMLYVVGIICQLRNHYNKLFDQLVCRIILHCSDTDTNVNIAIVWFVAAVWKEVSLSFDITVARCMLFPFSYF